MLALQPGIFLGAQSKTQANDIGSAINLVMEKSQDLKGAGPLAQADIKSYFDSLPILEIAQYLIEKRVGPSVVAAIVFSS